MKLTKTQFKQIIKEEMEEATTSARYATEDEMLSSKEAIAKIAKIAKDMEKKMEEMLRIAAAAGVQPARVDVDPLEDPVGVDDPEGPPFDPDEQFNF